MAGLLSYIAAGAAQGLGEGIVADGAARREAALKQYEADREDARYAQQQNDVSDTFTDDQGNVNTVSKGGLVKNTGVKAATKEAAPDNELVPVYDAKTKTTVYRRRSEAAGMPVPPKESAQPQPDRELVAVWDPTQKKNVMKPRSQAAGMEPAHPADKASEDGFSPGDKRLWDVVVKQNTKTNPDTGVEETDWEGASKAFKTRNRKDLADLALPPVETNQDRSSKDDGQGYGDGTDPETNPALQPKPAVPQGGPGGAAKAKPGKPPKGAGTTADPYTPTTQAEFDAMAPGTVYLNPKDQKLYKKKAAPGK